MRAALRASAPRAQPKRMHALMPLDRALHCALQASEDLMVAGESDADVADALHRAPTTPPAPGPRGKGLKGR